MKSKKDFTIIILIVIILITLYIFMPNILTNKEDFISSIDKYFTLLNSGINSNNLNLYDNFIENAQLLDDYNSSDPKLLIYKRCYRLDNVYAESLMNNNVSIKNIFGDIFNFDSNFDICIHKYIKYTADFGEIESSIINDITNFYNCKNRKNKNNPKIEGNVYVLFGQIPYLKNENDNSMSIQFNDNTQSYKSYINKNNNGMIDLTGGIVYVYYIIYGNYKSDYTIISDSNNTFSNYLPQLDKYTSTDNACKTENNNGFLGGCVSTMPQYNTNQAGNGQGSLLNKHITSVSSSLRDKFNDNSNIDFNNIYRTMVNMESSNAPNSIRAGTSTPNGVSCTRPSSGILSCPNSRTLIANALNIDVSSLDVASSFISNGFITQCSNNDNNDKNIYINKIKQDVSPYSSRCLSDGGGSLGTDTGNITTYMTLYILNKKKFIVSHNGITPEYMFRTLPA